MIRPKLGQVCHVCGQAGKTIEKRYNSSGEFDSAITGWERYPLPERTALFIGWRTWSIGRTDIEYEYADYQGGILSSWKEYRPTEHREVWFFVADERRKPFYAFPEDVRFDTEGEKLIT